MRDEAPASRVAQEIASRIRAIDAELDKWEQDRDESVIRGMKAPGITAVVNKWGQDRSDVRHEELLSERSVLVIKLKDALSK